ncbi:MAG: hypothetical protein JNM67_09295 [Bacteroidetes bacterium]|nr:hypothetical protein [Bacteroidota bacterium]
MGYLLLSVLFSACLFVLFKYFDRKGIPLLASIVGNYIACIVVGSLSTPKSSFMQYNFQSFSYHFILGFLFFAIFYLMGKSSSKNGVGITGMAGKMSLLLTVILLSIYTKTSITWVEILSLAIGLLALLIMGIEDKGKIEIRQLKLPILILLGSGIIDACLAILKERQLNLNLDQSPGIIYTFSGALCLAILANYKSIKSQILHPTGLLYGGILGLINYYSVHFLLLGIEHKGNMSLNQFYLANNIGVVVLTFMLGIVLFKESTNWKKFIGLVLALISIFFALKL